MSESSSNQKNQHGGFRKNAGRKPSTVRGLIKKLPGDTAKLILAELDAESKWKKLVESKDERLQFEVLKYLTDRAFGKPKQKVEHSGEEGGAINTSVVVRFVNAGS